MAPTDQPFDSDALAAEGLQWPTPVSDADILWLDSDARPAQAAAAAAATPVATVSATAAAAAMAAAPAATPATGVAAVPATAVAAALATAVAAAPAAAVDSVTLSTLLRISAAFEWHDGVAVVLGVADAMPSPDAGLPAFDAILLEPEGRFRIVDSIPGHSPAVRVLGALLQRLVSNKPLPVNLRLLASIVGSDAGTSMTLQQFIAEVSRWERPGRQQKLADLYRRALAAPLEERPEQPPVRPPEPPRPEPTAPAEVAAPQPQRINTRLAAIAAAIVTVLLVTGIAAWRVLQHADVPVRVSADRSPTTASSDAASTPDVDARRPSPPDRRHSEPRAQSRRQSRGIGLHRDRSPVVPAEQLPPREPRAQDAPTGLAPAAPAHAAVAVLGAAAARPTAVEPVIPPAESVALADPGPLFHTGDPGVIEPVLVKPHLPPQPRPDTPRDALGVLELVVDQRGHVESVHLHSPANRYREKWWLFAAKDWLFTPATKGGHAVRFLKRIPLTDLNMAEPQ